MSGPQIGGGQQTVQARYGRTLRFRVLMGVLVVALPGVASPFAHLSSRRLAFALGGEVFFALAAAAGVYAMRSTRTSRQGAAWTGFAALLVAAGYGFVALGLL